MDEEDLDYFDFNPDDIVEPDGDGYDDDMAGYGGPEPDEGTHARSGGNERMLPLAREDRVMTCVRH
jgi:hypothetical protein